MTPEQLLRHYDEALLWSPEQTAQMGTDVAQAYQKALAVRQLRVARGEQARGFKIGFTNRSIWQRYAVFGPIWGTVWNTTLTHSDGATQVSLTKTCQARLEPEVVFGMKARPPVGASVEALFDCIEWVAPGFEIVQSHAPGWKFNAAMTVADSGLHAYLVVGQKTPLAAVASSAQSLNAVLANCRVSLHQNGQLVECGQGSNVLDSPLLALHHFLQELHQCPGAPLLQAGDVVTTGTWTDAWPVLNGETWRANFDAPLPYLQVNFQ